jgi:hypothetical protein
VREGIECHRCGVKPRSHSSIESLGFRLTFR